MEDDFKLDLDYLAFGRKRADHTFARRRICGPWKVYAVSKNEPGVYYRVLKTGMEHADHVELLPEMDEYKKVYKWVIERDILSRPEARCHVEWDSVCVLLDSIHPRGSMH